MTISGRWNPSRLHEILTTQPESLVRMVQIREFSRKDQNEDFQSRPRDNFYQEGPRKRITEKGPKIFSKRAETRIGLEFELNIGFNIV